MTKVLITKLRELSVSLSKDLLTTDAGHGCEGVRRFSIDETDVRKLRDLCDAWLDGHSSNRPSVLLHCSKCNSTNVQNAEWVLPNTERMVNGRRVVEIADGEPLSNGDESHNWCEFCDDHTTLEEVANDCE